MDGVFQGQKKSKGSNRVTLNINFVPKDARPNSFTLTSNSTPLNEPEF